MKEKIEDEEFLKVLQNFTSHFCSSKVLFKKLPFPKNPNKIEELIYPKANIIIATYNEKSKEIWVNKHSAVINLFKKDIVPLLHEIYHAKFRGKMPERLTVKGFIKIRKRNEADATRWAQKQVEYYSKHPKKWQNLFTKKGKYWENKKS